MVEYIPKKNLPSKRRVKLDSYQNEICLRPYQLKAVQNFILSKPKNSNILELGSGGGHFSLWMLDHKYKNIICSDVDNYLKYQNLRRRFKKINLSYDKMPFKKNSFDGIVAIEVIEHLENMVFAFEEISRVLNKDGWFLMAIPNAANLRRRLSFLFTGDGLLISETNDHLQNITDSLVRKLVSVYFGKNAKIELLKYNVKFPFLRFSLPYIDLLADNKIYIIKKN